MSQCAKHALLSRRFVRLASVLLITVFKAGLAHKIWLLGEHISSNESPDGDTERYDYEARSYARTNV